MCIRDRLKAVYENFGTYEWAWVANALERDFGKPIDRFTSENVVKVIQTWIDAVERLDLIRCSDAGKEFNANSRIGFGVDGTEAERDSDFEAVRGTAEDNSFITELKDRLEKKKKSAAKLIDKLQRID